MTNGEQPVPSTAAGAVQTAPDTAPGPAPGTAPPERSPRERMVLAAAQLMRTQGVNGAGLREIVDKSGAPWGSFRHYFPGGKEQLIREAILFTGDFAARRVTKFMATATQPTPGDLFAAVAGEWQRLYERAGYAEGCPLAAAAADTAATSPALREALSEALGRWQRPLERALETLGVPESRRPSLALLMIVGLEGALIVARSREDASALQTVIEELRPILNGAVVPASPGGT